MIIPGTSVGVGATFLFRLCSRAALATLMAVVGFVSKDLLGFFSSKGFSRVLGLSDFEISAFALIWTSSFENSFIVFWTSCTSKQKNYFCTIFEFFTSLKNYFEFLLKMSKVSTTYTCRLLTSLNWNML